MFSQEGKLSIHCLGESYLCQMGQKDVSRQDKRYCDNNSQLCTIWDDYLTNAALTAMANGYEISMDQRANKCGEEYMGPTTFTQTLTIRTPSGHVAKIQTVVSQEPDIRRHVLSTSTSRNPTPTCRSSQSTSSTRAVCSSPRASQYSPLLSI